MRYYGGLIIGLLLIALLAGCGGGGGTLADLPAAAVASKEEAAQHGAWTVLIYVAADNDLESAAIHNINQMEMVGSSRDIRIVIQVDRAAGYDTSNGDWTDTRRYLITRDSDPSRINSIRLDNPPIGEQESGDWRVLKDFVEWGTREFPADNYCLVLWDHGSGWQIRASSLPQYKYIVTDNTSGKSINITDIYHALAGVDIDVIAFDACFMQQLEVAYQLRNCADYCVGSATTEPSPGYNYSRWLRRISASTTPEQLCRTIVDEYAAEYPPNHRCITQSAVDLNRIEELASATSSFAQLLINNRMSYYEELNRARSESLDYSNTNAAGGTRWFLDLWDYTNRSAAVLGSAGTDAFAAVSEAMSNALVIERHNPDMPNAHGIAIYMPPPNIYDWRYQQLDLAGDTLWNEWIQAQLQ